jgi:phosphotransferase system enzyme I (PtsP)
MLSTLRTIVQEVNSARDLQEALSIIVSRVQKAMNTEVCSVYLLDPATNRYVLMATEGLYRKAVGKVSLGYSEGLVGLVGSREEPINLEDAPSHPRYRYFPETGEERFRSFLGVPIIHHRRLMGVLVVQQRESSRSFNEGEEAFMVTISAQLSGVIAHSEATGAIGGLSLTGEEAHDIGFDGVPGAPGVAIGTGVTVYPAADLDLVPEKTTEDIEHELDLFQCAVTAVREDIERVAARLASQLRPQEQALFDVYLRMLSDEALPD